MYQTAPKSADTMNVKNVATVFCPCRPWKKIPCPDCEAEIDYEIGPDESLEDVLDTAELIKKIEGEEEVEKMDALLSLAVTGGDYNWIWPKQKSPMNVLW